MPAYSGGNRWVGVLALGPVPVPPALHQMAQRRAAGLTAKRTHIALDGRTISAKTAQKALSDLGVVLGVHGDMARVAESFALARSVGQGKAETGSWPQWARNAVLRYSANPTAFNRSQKYDLNRWGLGLTGSLFKSDRTQARRQDATKGRASVVSARHVERVFDTVDVDAPTILDPGQVLDELPVSRRLTQALTEARWQPEGVLRQRWLRLALTHASFRSENWSIPQRTLLPGMLGGLGSRWCQLFALDEFLADNPLASPHEQSQALNSLMPLLADQLAGRLHIPDAMLLGRGEVLAASEPSKRSSVLASVTWQVVGAMCLLDGRTAVARLVHRGYRSIVEAIDPDTSSVDWLVILTQHNESGVTWTYDSSGPDHQLVHRAVVTDRRGRSGSGSGASKRSARQAAAESFVRRYLPDVAKVRVRTRKPEERSTSLAKARTYSGVGVAHENAIQDLRRNFELPPAAARLLTQALTHSSWVYENNALVLSAGQRDYAALSRLGAVVDDALVAHDQVVRIASTTLAPTEDEARIMSPAEARLWDLFRDFRLEAGLLIGAGIRDVQLPSIGAGAMQAVLAVAWKYRRDGLLMRRPSPLNEWLRVPNAPHDETTALQYMCAQFKINYEPELRARGVDHEKQFICLLRFEDMGGGDFVVKGSAGTSKSDAKRRVAAVVLAAIEGISDSQVPENAALTRFLVRKQIAGVATVDPHRALLRGWLGVSLIASADIPAFERWAASAENVTGPLGDDQLARLRSYYERCLLTSRQRSLQLLRSAFSTLTEWLEGVPAAEVKDDPRWPSFRAVAATLRTVTATSNSSLREVLSHWYAAVVGRINVDLSSENLEGERDDLTAAQASALRVMLDAATTTALGNTAGDRLQVAVYRRDGAAYVTVTAASTGIQETLAEFAHLLNECVSYLECVEIEHGWLMEVRYVEGASPRRWADLGRIVESVADQRTDLTPLASRADELVRLIESGAEPESIGARQQILASELHQRRNLI